MSINTLTPREARQLALKEWVIQGQSYRFGDRPRGGGEAFVYPMYDKGNHVVAYARFLRESAISEQRIIRTDWLIAQGLPSLSPAFHAAPRLWASTETYGLPEGVHQHFSATLHNAVDGVSWREWKSQIENGSRQPLQHKQRYAIAKSLIAHLATWEIYPLIHGDLSDGNFLVSPSAYTVTLIDYDGFVAPPESKLQYRWLDLGSNGIKGTPGYMPQDLEALNAADARPYSDRHARDMLLLEILGYCKGDPSDLSPRLWDKRELLMKNAAQMARDVGLNYLLRDDIFSLSEDQRLSSRELAIAASCPMPEYRQSTARGHELQSESITILTSVTAFNAWCVAILAGLVAASAGWAHGAAVSVLVLLLFYSAVLVKGITTRLHGCSNKLGSTRNSSPVRFHCNRPSLR